ncbi:cytochrome d ubiquinol oxidase subunit II [Tumebacillus flagellatus]|uniref:Cytochrome D ubiquinol oxidase subunit II n=1 Tax=Tumebacillus flagellatus TaxID=1157490 RepID=A0A074LPP6_9BACL|nr:cytochrome d ubiquinol oxidase subunit II [Tumebacillus flagellatus]KEO82470.1 cytochrome D ubiquinol oxidase subunit II [Tumebacillus flagellatus]
MSLENVGITVLWMFLYGYVIVASIDFGAGFFSYYSFITGREHLVNGVIERYLSPMWEVTNVFLIFFMVGLIGFYPDTAYYYGTALLVPGSIALVLLALRGSFYAFSHYAKSSALYRFLYGATGLFIPASLATVLTISEGGFIDENNGKVTLALDRLLSNPYSWAVVLVAVTSVLYISASFLAYYAKKARDPAAAETLRRFALATALPTIFASLLVFFTLRTHNPGHFERMLDIYPLFLGSFGCFLVAFALQVTRKSYGWAFVWVMLQFLFALFGYGASHLPYLLEPYIKVHDSITSPQMGLALVIGLIAGLCLLIPSLVLLMKLFLFNTKYASGKLSEEP